MPRRNSVRQKRSFHKRKPWTGGVKKRWYGKHDTGTYNPATQWEERNAQEGINSTSRGYAARSWSGNSSTVEP